MFAGKKSAQIREILISESAWEEMTCLFAPSLTDKGNGLKTKLSKLIYFCLVLGISTIPLWNAVFWEAANSNVTIFSSDNVINREISKKCRIINKYYDVNVIERCR